MLPESAKNKIEQIWLDVIAGGVSQPTEVIEQLTYLMFAKQLDEMEADIETSELLSGKAKSICLVNPMMNSHYVGEILENWKQDSSMLFFLRRYFLLLNR